MPALRAMRGERPGPRQNAVRPPVPPARLRTLLGPPTPRPPPPAPATRSLSGRAAAPLLAPAPLFSPFFPFLRGGASRAEPGAGRRGEEEEAEDEEKEEERGELLPRPAAGAPQSLAL